MAQLPAPGVARCAVLQSLASGTEIVNLLHVRRGDHSAALTDTDLHDIANAVKAAWGDKIMPNVGSYLTLENVTAKDLTTNLGNFAVSGGGAVVGGRSGSGLPANVALVASWEDGISYRGGHIRTYLGGLLAADVANPQHISESARLAYGAAWVAFVTELNLTSVGASTAELCAVHYRLNRVIQAPPLVRPILSVRVNARYDSQRRRLGT